MATKVHRLSKAPGKAPSAVLQWHIELRGTKPKIWRRVLVPSSITLARLHHVIQAAFGWSGGHLHEFMAGEQRYGTESEYDMPGSVQSERTRFTAALHNAAAIDYVYDFGDNWRHRQLAPSHQAREDTAQRSAAQRATVRGRGQRDATR